MDELMLINGIKISKYIYKEVKASSPWGVMNCPDENCKMKYLK